MASGEIDVSSVRLAIASPPEAPGAPGAESPEEQHRSEADGGSPAEGANLTSPLPDDGGNLHDALAPPVDHRRWIMMGVGLALVLGIISLYFLSTSKRQATPATQRTPAKAAPAPVGSSGTEAAVESSGGSDAAGTAVTSAEEGAPSVDAGGRGVESSEDSGAPAAAVKNQPEDTDLLPGINKVPPRAKTPRKRGASPRPRKKLYRKTIDPFAE